MAAVVPRVGRSVDTAALRAWCRERLAAYQAPVDGGELAANDDKPMRPLVIKGTEGMVMHFAKCCRPIPGDPVMGIVTKGRGMVIHTESCRNLAENKHPQEHLLGHRDSDHGGIWRYFAVHGGGTSSRVGGDDSRLCDHRGAHGHRDRRTGQRDSQEGQHASVPRVLGRGA